MYENEIENIASRGTNEEIYYGLLELTKNAMQQRGKIEGKKKLYYISAEFLLKMQCSRGERLRERRNSIISQQSFF